MLKRGFRHGAGFALATLWVLAGAAGAASATPPADAQALLERHVAWLGGWAALDSLRDLSLEGTLEVAGLTGTLKVQLRSDGRQRTEYDLKVLAGVECVDGADAWERNASGQIEEMGVPKALQARRGLDRAFGRHLRGAGVVVSLNGTEEKGGRAWSVLRFAYPDSDFYDLLVDPATGESVWSRERVDGQVQWTLSSDEREVGGQRFAFRQQSFYGEALQNQTVTWSKFAMNSGLADSVFQRSPTARKAPLYHLPDGATASAWQPMELYLESFIYLQGRVNGVATDIVLDSGAGMTVLDAPTAKRVGLEPTGTMPARGTGGTTSAGLVEGVTLELGDLKLGPVVAAVIDLADINRRLGRDLSVILGKEVFHELIVDVDYPNQRLRFLDPATFRYDGPGRRLEVLPGDDGHKNVRLSVEGLPEALFGLDTGQNSALTLFRQYTDDHRLLEGRRTSVARGGGVGGTEDFPVGRLAKVGIAGYEFSDVPVSFHRSDVGGAFDTARLAGNLGGGLLKRFRVIFDYPHGCLWLEPGGQLTEPLPRDRTGLQVRREGQELVVEFVAPGSPAAAAGWRPDERVTALDGVAVTADWWKTWAAWARAADGAVVRLTMADGAVRSLTLASYY